MAKKRIKAVLAWLLVCSMVLPMFPTVMDAEAAETQVADEYNYASKTVKEILEIKDRSLTWVFAGDSITHNATWTGAMNGYSEWFEQYLYDIGRGDDSVVLTAWGGANTYDFQTKENTPNNSSGKYGVYADPGKGIENMITKYNPDVIFIKLGMNDRAKATANVGKYYKQMLESIDEQMSASGKKPKIVLLSSTPVSEETWYDNQYHGDTYVDSQQARGSVRRSKIIYEEIANQKGLEFIDLEQAFLEEEVRLGTDYSRIFFYESYSGAPGIHPSAAGQYYIFKTICKELDIYKEDMPIFQLEYEDILSHALYTDETSMEVDDYQGNYGSASSEWTEAFTENYVWAVAGAQQMSGYETVVGERSLFRYLDNAMRAGSGDTNHRDIRLYNLASPAYVNGLTDINAAYENTMAIRDYNVFMLLPEIPQVYEDGYQHDSALVDAYKAQVTDLLDKQNCEVKILWTPLASGDADLNANVIAAYAEAIRTVAEEKGVLLFDAYQFMIDKMATNDSLMTNWFEEGPYISPLCAVDVARAFYTQVSQSGTAQGVLKNHNLRYTSDTQNLKGQYVRDYVKASYEDNGDETFTVDISNIATKYESQITNWEFKVLPYKGAGNFNTKNHELTPISTVEEKYAFNAPCSEFCLAVYGTIEDKIYRFKDLNVSVQTDAVITEETPVPTKVCLDSLEVIGAPSAIELVEGQYTYEVPLYQYQSFVKVKATAAAGLTINVGEEEVVSGTTSMPVKVDDKPISVTVTYGTQTETYTLTLKRAEQPDIIITEVLQEAYRGYNNAPNDIYELVEIYNASGEPKNLLDYSLGFKKDYTYNRRITEGNVTEYPYYFIGNEQTFSVDASYTGIKPITKYTKWSTNAPAEPEEIIIQPDQTMVIWIRSATGSDEAALSSYYDTYTYDTLIAALKDNQDCVLSVNGNSVIPTQEQVVVAAPGVNVTSDTLKQRHNTVFANVSNWVIDQFSGYHNTTGDSITRGWLFITKDTAEPAKNGAITEAGNDIISAAKFVRVGTSSTGGTDKLSSVFSYNYDRGMSVVKNENVVVEDKIGVGNTSDVMGYSNLTSFGAIEYWQKAMDFDDKTAPTLVDVSAPYASVEPESVTISLKVKDETDLRYVELYTRKAGETEFTKTSTDYVLEACVANAGVASDVNTEQTITCEITEPGQKVEYYARALDGNGHETLLGSEENPILLTGLRKTEPIDAEIAKTKIGKEAPTCASDTDGSYVFAGWYADEACVQTPIRTAVEVTGDKVYALFVTKDVLSVKAQLDVQDTDTDKADLRFVTTVDSLRYKTAGFKITINETPFDMPSNTVYTKLYAVNEDQSVDTLYPQIFSEVSNYFWAVTVTGIPRSAWGGVITVEPYWVTMDGITVNGESAGKSVTLGMTGSEAKIGNTYYHTFDAAFANAVNNDTIELFKDVTIDKTYMVNKKLTITNALGNNVTLTRNAADAMFTVANGATLAIEGDESNSIKLDGNKTALTATNSMIVNDGTFTLGTNATLTNGGADSLDYGGALRNTGTAKLQGTISGHTAVNGGAIYNYGAGQITYDGGTYTSNTSIGRGGAMYGTGTSSTTVTNGTFSQNTAQGQYGGGVFGIAGNASLTVNGGTFTENSANNASYDGTSAYGGGAIESNGDLTINGGTFESNTAYNGGAIYLDSSCTATITAGTFGSKDKGNTAENSGGAIYLKKSSKAGAKVTIEGGTFAYNEAAGTTGGGAIAGAALTTIEIKGGTFNHNSATSTTTDTYGGGVIESAGTVAISNGLFESNQALNGGVIYMNAGGELSISAGEFYSNKTLNQADAAGGVIYQNGDGLNITGGTFGAPGKGNISYQRGGAIYVADGDALPEQANITIKNAIFSYNTAQQTNKASGGMMYVGANSFVDIQNCTIDNNETEDTGTANGIYYMGGVMYVTNAKVTVQESQFSYNKAKLGGVVYITGNTSEFTVTDSDFVYNQATGTSSTATNSGWGGVICNNAATVIANSSTFKNNSAWRGGVVYNYSSGQLTLNDCEFGVEAEVNSVTQYGQDIHAETGSVTLSGKANLVIDKKNVIIYINEKLKEGSCITVGQLSNYSTVAQFADENIMNDCKNNAYIVFISKNATLTSSGKVLTYESNKAIMK